MNKDYCNICKLKQNECLGHGGVKGYLWNLHPDYDYYKEYLANKIRLDAGLATYLSNLPVKPNTWQ